MTNTLEFFVFHLSAECLSDIPNGGWCIISTNLIAGQCEQSVMMCAKQPMFQLYGLSSYATKCRSVPVCLCSAQRLTDLRTQQELQLNQ